MELVDRVAFVTGGSGGLGSVIVTSLAKNGVDVAIGYRERREAAEQVAAEVSKIGRRATVVEMDQSKNESVGAAVDEVVRNMRRLDILVNNAAWTAPVPFRDLDALTPEIWDRIHGTNLRGPFLVARTSAPHLCASGSGRIVNISAFVGLSPEGSSIAHSTAKAALIHLNRCLAVALAPEVTVNSVAPGLMEGTAIFRRLLEKTTEGVRERTILKRHTSMQDVADQVVAFCKSDSVTGQVLVVDGGLVFH